MALEAVVEHEVVVAVPAVAGPMAERMAVKGATRAGMEGLAAAVVMGVS